MLIPGFISRIPTHPHTAHKIHVQRPSQKGIKNSPLEGGLKGMALRTILLMIFLILPFLLFAQDYSTTINKTARFQNVNSLSNELRVYNINGSVTVDGYNGDEIQVTADEQIDGSDEEVQRAKGELRFKVEQSGDQVLVYLDAPFITLKRNNGQINYNVHRDDDDYDFQFDIHIRVPEKTIIHASTINKGMVSITHTIGKVFASNINGDVELHHIADKTDASTINGDITITYDKSPNEDSEYHTVNGNIEVYYPRSLSADIRFMSMHGDLYTDFEDVRHLKAQVKTGKENGRGKKTYRVDRFMPIRIGNGGPTFNFKVLNGNVYIKKIKS